MSKAQNFRGVKRPLAEGRVYCHVCLGYGQRRFRFSGVGGDAKDWKFCGTCEGTGQLARDRFSRNQKPEIRNQKLEVEEGK